MTSIFSGRSRFVALLVTLASVVLLVLTIVAVDGADLHRLTQKAGIASATGSSARSSADAASMQIGAAGLTASKPAIQPLTGPWVIAIQPGHWKVSELPDELYRLRTSTGAEYGGVREVDINVAVANALVTRLKSDGWDPIMVPATIPPGLRVDAFVALHADWGPTPDRRGWKLSPPWRQSGASTKLAAALASAFGAQKNLVEDADGVTVNMRGYYAFNPRRFTHAASPYTPEALIEMGFITNAQDRALLTQSPDFFAAIIERGLEQYFAGRTRSETDDLAPMDLPWVAAGPAGATVHRSASDSSDIVARIDPGSSLMPVDQSDGWYEVFVRHVWGTGWVRKDQLVPSIAPSFDFPPRSGSVTSGSENGSGAGPASAVGPGTTGDGATIP